MVGMYGREQQMLELKTAVDLMMRRNDSPSGDRKQNKYGSKQLVLVSGYSGTGKSRLVSTSISDLVQDQLGGIAAVGKFDQSLDKKRSDDSTTTTIVSGSGTVQSSQQKAEGKKNRHHQQQRPFSAFAMVCNGLARGILSMKHHTRATTTTNDKNVINDAAASPSSIFESLKDHIMMELGTELIDLVQVFPSLEVIVSSRGNDTANTSSVADHHYDAANTPSNESHGDITPLHRHDSHSSLFGPSPVDGWRSTTSLQDVNSSMFVHEKQSKLGGYVQREARNRFIFSFRSLMRVVSLYISPLVIILDDLQWADGASLDLLEGLLSGCDQNSINSILIVGIYRSNEVDEAHRLSKTLRDIKTNASEKQVSVTEMEIGNLGVGDVHDLLQDLLISSDNDVRTIPTVSHGCVMEAAMRRETTDKIWQFANVCHKKTGGNPFYLKHFLLMLYDNHLLKYDLQTTSWIWNINDIEQETEATQNIVDVLKTEMSSLAAEHQRLLQCAAYLGTMFNKTCIFALWRHFQEQQGQQRNLQRRKRQSKKKRVSSRRSLSDSTLNERKIRMNSSNTSEQGGGESNDTIVVAIREGLHEGLRCCEEAGFLQRIDFQTYRWVHDKLQEAAMNLIPPKEQRRFSRRVAEVLASQLSDQQLEAIIFVVANRYNEGATPRHSEKRLEMARLNLRAAKKAVSFAAFESAATYCEHGIKLLPSDRWENHYDLSLELYSLGSETEGFLGNLYKIEKYSKEVLSHVAAPDSSLWPARLSRRQHTTSMLHEGRKGGGVRDKFRVYFVMVNSIFAQGHFQEAATLCLDVLREYGTTFPKSSPAVMSRIVCNVVKIKSSVKSRTAQEVEKMRFMDDPARVEQMRILDKLSTCLYYSIDELLPLVIFRSLQITLDYGLCVWSPVAFATTALIMAGVLGDLRLGRVYAKYALMLLAKLDSTSSKQVESRTILIAHVFALQWTQPMGDILKPVLRGYEVGMQSGDLVSATHCIHFYMLISFYLGRNLGTIEEDCRAYIAQMKELKQGPSGHNARILWQVVLNLMGRSQFKTRLTGEAMKEDVFRKMGETNPFLLAVLEANVQVLCSFFGDFKTGAELAIRRGDRLQQVVPGSPTTINDIFHQGLACFAMARRLKEDDSIASDNTGTASTSKKTESKYAKVGKKKLLKIKKLVEQGNPNIRHHESLLAAEYAAYQGQTGLAKRKYESAIALANQDDFLQDVALANERYGRFLLYRHEKSDTVVESQAAIDEAAMRLRESIECYHDWGAYAKVEELQDRYGYLVASTTGTVTVLRK